MNFIKAFLLSFILLLNFQVWANMANPWVKGTFSSSPFISKYVDITHENILIIPDQEFKTAEFRVEYHIKAHKAGYQIPFLFYASDFHGHFRIWVDGNEVNLNGILDNYKNLEGTSFADFSYFFDTGIDSSKTVVVAQNANMGNVVHLNDLKFFETDLSEGNHIIRVEYIADSWFYKANWVNETSFRYVLSPAKYWKSFGTLQITLDASNFKGKLTSNLGIPISENIESKTIWRFSKLPSEMLLIYHIPEISYWAQLGITITPIRFGLFFLVSFFVLHLWALVKYRKKFNDKMYSRVLVIGNIVIPFVAMAIYILSYSFIHTLIGEENRGKYHAGYVFMNIILYPVVLLIYTLVTWLIGIVLKKYYSKSNTV